MAISKNFAVKNGLDVAGVVTATSYSGSGANLTGLTKAQVGLSNVEDKSSATIRSEITSLNVTTALGYTPLSNAGGAVAGDLTMTGNIIPSADVTYDLGSPTMMWRDLYIGPHSIYMNGKKILEDVSDTITFSTDVDQNLRIQTSGAGSLELQAASGNIQIKGTMQITSGKKILDSAGIQIEFGDNIEMGGNKITNVGAPSATTDAANKAYVDGLTTGDATIVRTSGDQTVAGNKTFSNNVVINGNLTVSGTSTTVVGETVLINDNIIELNSNFTTGDPTENAGFQVRRGDFGVVRFIWDEANDRFTMTDGAATPAYKSLYTTATITAGTFVGALTGNSDTATKLATARTINGVSFDGSANISFGTDAVTEGATNQYFTTARARSSIAVSGTVLSYNSTTGVLSFAASTSDVTEGANLYYTEARARDAISATGSLAYNATTGVISYTTPDTDGIVEGTTNKYYTDTRARAAISVSGSGLSYLNGVITSNATTVNNANTLVLRNANGDFSAGTIYAALSGNATTATSAGKLTTAVTINGVSFDGSANITVADSTKLPTAGGTMTGNITLNNATYTAAGTSQAAAVALAADVSIITASTAGSAIGARLPAGVAGKSMSVINASANAITLWTVTSGTMNGTLNGSVTVPANSALQFVSSSETSWFSLSATYA